jgi:hypothetical protein
MLKSAALAYFKSNRRLARAIDVSEVAVCHWDKVIPYFSAQEIERVTDGAVKFHRELYDRRRPLKGRRLAEALRSLRAGLRAQSQEVASVVDHE